MCLGHESVVSHMVSMQMNSKCAPHLFSIKSSQKSFAPLENINIFVGSSSEGHMTWIVILPLGHGRSRFTHPKARWVFNVLFFTFWWQLIEVTCLWLWSTELDQTSLPLSHVNHTSLRHQVYPAAAQQLMGRFGLFAAVLPHFKHTSIQHTRK